MCAHANSDNILGRSAVVTYTVIGVVSVVDLHVIHCFVCMSHYLLNPLNKLKLTEFISNKVNVFLISFFHINVLC